MSSSLHVWLASYIHPARARQILEVGLLVLSMIPTKFIIMFYTFFSLSLSHGGWSLKHQIQKLVNKFLHHVKMSKHISSSAGHIRIVPSFHKSRESKTRKLKSHSLRILKKFNNQGIEGQNRDIKASFTFRKKMPLGSISNRTIKFPFKSCIIFNHVRMVDTLSSYVHFNTYV